jgi:hypothetical protein
MCKQRNKPVIIALALVLSISTGLWAGPVAAEPDLYEQQGNDRSAGAMVVDALAVRPLGMAATLLGSAVFIISLPFSALGGNVDEAAQSLVVTPARFTFVRPLGEYGTYR